MKATKTPIRSFVKELLNSNPHGVACWEEQVRGAATRLEWLPRLIHTRRGIDIFTRLSEVASGRPNLKVYARRFGTDLGTIYLRRDGQPTFRLKTPGKNAALNHTFEAVRREMSSAEAWQNLVDGCDWNSPFLRQFFSLIVAQPLSLALASVKEQPLEDAFIRSLRGDLFWFTGCQLAEDQNLGQAFPFKFRLPIRVEQGDTDSMRAGSWRDLILKPGTPAVAATKQRTSYGAPDVMVRCHGPFGRQQRRLAILELKQPKSTKTQISLLQGYAYAVVIAELQQRCQATASLHHAFRGMLGYTGSKPCPIPMAAYAVVHQDDVSKVQKDNSLTDAVLQECGDLLVGILGYKLCKDTRQIKLTSAVQWVEEDWKDIQDFAERDFVSLIA